MVKYVLKYFPIRGRAEVARLMFAYAGVEYDDVRISTEEWPKHKAGAPMGQMPVLEVDGDALCQSHAINRFLARKFGLNGKNELEDYYIDMFVDCFEDLGRKYPFTEKDEAKKAELLKEYMDVTVSETFKKIETVLVNYNGGGVYFSSKISMADFTLVHYVDFYISKKPDILSGTPKLEAIYKKVRAEPKVAAWIAKRPETEF